MIGLYQCHCMAESCWHLPLACLGLDITVKEIGTCSALWSIICSLHRIFFHNILKILFKEEHKLSVTMQTSFCDLSWHTASSWRQELSRNWILAENYMRKLVITLSAHLDFLAFITERVARKIWLSIASCHLYFLF